MKFCTCPAQVSVALWIENIKEFSNYVHIKQAETALADAE